MAQKTLVFSSKTADIYAEISVVFGIQLSTFSALFTYWNLAALVFTVEATILEMLANHCMCEVDAINKTAILMKKSIVELFEYMFVVFVHSNVVMPNKVVH